MPKRYAAVSLLWAFVVFSCAALGQNAATTQPAWECIPGGERVYMPTSPRAYAAMCEPELGVAPTVDCAEGVLMPVTVDGVEVFEDPGLHACDKPSLQIGDCMPGSSLQRYPGTDADGTPRPEVVWVSFCRHDGRDDVVGFDMPDSVQMIGYNYETGATCFFESGDNRPWTSVDETNRLRVCFRGRPILSSMRPTSFLARPESSVCSATRRIPSSTTRGSRPPVFLRTRANPCCRSSQAKTRRTT